VVVAGVTFWIVNVLLRWSLGVPLGHDEARYALDANEVLNGEPTRFLYSPPGMTLVAMPGLLAGGSEYALRALPIGLGLAFLWTVWWFARTVGSERTAAWSVAVMSTSPSMPTHGGELLSDLPSAACLLAAITLLISELSQGEGLRRRIVWVAPLCAAAFYLRYGSAAPIAVIGAVFAIVGWRAMLRRPWRVVCMVVLFVLLLAPHAIRARELTGSVLGILDLSAEIPGEAEGVVAYLREPFAKYGFAIAPLMVVGLIAPLLRRRERFARALQLVALGQISLLAATTQVQPRFIYLATVILTVLGIDALVRMLAAPRTGRAVSIGMLGIVVLALAVANLAGARTSYPVARRDKNARTLIAASTIRGVRDASRRCEVVAGRDRTRLEWYSRCRVLIDSHDEGSQLFRVGDGQSPTVASGEQRVLYLPGLLDVVRLR
jgi:4-amino-4-deoxy-L-arabinose transferase-like glycosyltransferase